MNAKPAKALSFEGFHSEEELRALRTIVAREESIDQLLQYCCTFEEDCSVELLEAILVVRECSLDVIDAIAGWRRRMVQKRPFLWRETNYLLRMCCDLDFLSRSQNVIAAMDGVRLLKRNPFSTIGGLDQSMRLFWQLELPEEDDLPVLLDSTSFSVGMKMEQSSKIRLAEHFLLLEEKRYGKLTRSEAVLDPRMKTLIQKEAAFSSKARFGAIKRSEGSTRTASQASGLMTDEKLAI
ncbi:hypothetical protein Poli38472_010470 [Pythium oligandrum]|uniref:Uncharacterized protein n=1 Tax=Pythium oligandrum TaxID=41045 RepID=A0A8K1FE75_PYTOL|nr:hypothetical protein Poli38472_010470 [Pythium oligandrum]|eukprot:TMW55588.1 hypothetical protein Poli38472_010470 [Pythium oligandrum]